MCIRDRFGVLGEFGPVSRSPAARCVVCHLPWQGASAALSVHMYVDLDFGGRVRAGRPASGR
eukprot:5701360-Alexandrium_andersonii.AAC.1